jgi:hypothetical protein
MFAFKREVDEMKMNRETKEVIVRLYDQEIAEAKSKLAALEPSSQESSKWSLVSGISEDLMPREIAGHRGSIAELETLRRELTEE